jgi:hypothetical protein
MTFWIGVVIGVIVGANLGALMLALCIAAKENHRADVEWNRGALVKRHSAARVMSRWARALGSLNRVPRRAS